LNIDLATERLERTKRFERSLALLSSKSSLKIESKIVPKVIRTATGDRIIDA
jgi:hypothetical protein